MSDLIRREDAIDALKRAEAITKAFGYHNVIETIRELPSAQPEREKSKWTYIDEAMFGNPHGSYKCSVCDNRMPYKTNFCQRCGADMRETGGDANEISRFK